MALPVTSLLSWYYTFDTKLGLYFNDFGLNAEKQPISSFNKKGLDSFNGMGASLNEDYHFENMITNHPVENNAAISDHIIAQPNIITVTGLITSMRLLPAGGISFTQLGNAVELLSSMANSPLSNQGLTLVTGLLYGQKYARFDNLAIQSLDIPRTNEYGRTSIKFTMVLKQLIITSQVGGVTSSGFSQGQRTFGPDIQ